MNIDTACEALMAAKLELKAAQGQHAAAEDALAALVGSKPEGSKTIKGTRFKVMTTGVVYRKVDEAALESVRARLSADTFDQVFRFKPEVVTAGVRYLQNNEPALYAIAAQAITATPGKVRVEVVEIEQAAQAA